MHIAHVPTLTYCSYRRLNLATYVTTHMEAEVNELIQSAVNINLADAVQYPSCVTMNDRRETQAFCRERMPRLARVDFLGFLC